MLSANTIYKIIVADCEQIHVGDVVMAWDDDETALFRVGFFNGYDHTKCRGMCPFLVKTCNTVLPYTHVKRVPHYLVSECGIEPEHEQLGIPLNYEEGSNG